jgi:hypothetical protein
MEQSEVAFCPFRPSSRRCVAGSFVALGQATVRVMRDWRTSQLQERRAWGPAWADGAYVSPARTALP